jgi:predicted phage tail protein
MAATNGAPQGSGGTDSQASIAAAIQEVSDKAQVLIREEIELAKAEVNDKISKLVKGAVVAAAAGFFVLGALLLLLHGLAWLAYDLLPTPDQKYFWGFFFVAGVLLLLGGVAGYLAARAFKAGSPPAPSMAIEEARLIKETVTSDHPRETVT